MADDDAVEAINLQTMTLQESETFRVDASNYLGNDETIIGIRSNFISPTTGAPTISEVTYSNDGKSVTGRINATVDGVTPGVYTLAIRVTTQKGDVTDNRELRMRLKVVR